MEIEKRQSNSRNMINKYEELEYDVAGSEPPET